MLEFKLLENCFFLYNVDKYELNISFVLIICTVLLIRHFNNYLREFICITPDGAIDLHQS